jgi:hypothetical protein
VLWTGNSSTLLIVGGMDMPVIEMNKTAYDELHCIKEMKIITGASRLKNRKTVRGR